MTFLARDNENFSIEVEFNAGYFTEADDLQTLSEVEAQQFLRLKNSKVLVVLSEWGAEAIGDHQEADAG